MPRKSEENSEKMVSALSSGLSILRFLSRRQDPIGVNSLARELSLNPSTCFNLLKTLVREELIEFDPDEKTYRAGYGLVALARGQLERSALVDVARPHLEALANAHAITATLWLRLGQDRLILADRADNGDTISVYMAIGRKIPLYIAALGRCIAGHLDLSPEQLREAYSRLRWQSAPNFNDYLREVEKAKADGVAVDQDHFWKGVTAVAAPVLDPNGTPLGGVSAVGFTGQFTTRSLKALTTDIRDRGRIISESLLSPLNRGISNAT